VRWVLVHLSDRTAVVIRPIRAADKPLLASALLRLSPASSRARFLTPKSHLSSRELRYLTEVDGEQEHALVAVLGSDPERLVAVARYVRLAEDPNTAELAIVIGDELQGLGLGRQLGVMLAEHARARGVRRFAALMLSDNVAAHRLLATISRHLSSQSGGAGVEQVVAELVA
jgi:RimJ/RimL family protein N-acetyltransferase